MPNPRTLFLITILLTSVLAAGVEARAPKAFENVSNKVYPDGQEGTDLAMDAGGRFVFVAMRPDPNVACGATSPIGGEVVRCKADLAGWDLNRATALPSVVHSQNRRPTGDAAFPVVVAVTPADPGTEASKVHAVKAGPGGTYMVVRAQQSTPIQEGRIDSVIRTAAIPKDNSRVILGGGEIHGNLTVWSCCERQPLLRWNTVFPNERVNVLAVAKDAHRMIVGTDKAVYFHTNLNVPDLSQSGTPNRWTRVVQSPVRAVDISHDGMAAVVGLDNGQVWYFDTSTRERFDSYHSSSLDGAVTAVAVSGDGKRFGAVTSAREFGLWEAKQDNDGPVAVRLYRYQGSAAFQSLDASRDGSTFVAGAGSAVLGFTPLREQPAWTIPLADEVRGVAVSDDARRVTAASKTRFYGWQQTSEVLVEGLTRERNAMPGETVPYSYQLTNAGSLLDNYSITVVKPGASWIVDGERQWRHLAPDTSGRVEFTLQSPSAALPQKHMGHVEVFSQRLDTVIHREFFNLSIASVSNLRMVSDQGQSLTLNQGEEVPYVFKVINQGNSYARLNITVSQATTQGAPWTITYPERHDGYNLTQGSEQSFTAAIAAPRDALDGTCNRITFSAVSGRTGASLPVVACVNPRYQIALTLEETAVSVRSGEASVVKLRVENRGNTEDRVTLEASVLPAAAALDWRVDVDPREVTLAQGGVRTATVSVRAAVPNPPDASVTVRAVSLGDTPQTATLSASAAPLEEDRGLPGPTFLALLAVAALAALASSNARRPGKR